MKNLLLLLLILGLLLSCAAAPVYQGPVSDHFDGTRFKNTLPDNKGLLDILKLSLTFPFKKAEWPEQVNPQTTPDEVVATVERGIAYTVINHSTVLIQVDGVNILTDPIFAERASPFTWAGPKRVLPPAISLPQLPPIDLVLISHNHYDHLDIEALLTLRRINDNHQPLILAGLGNGRLFDKHGLTNYLDMDWGDVRVYKSLEIEFTESRHRSGRGLADQMKTLWGAFVISTPSGKIYFGGDTGYGPHFRTLRDKHGGFKLAFIPIGAYEPRWFMAPVHLNPEEAVLAHQELGSEKSVAIHHSTFQLTYEAIDEPKKRLRLALANSQLSAQEFTTPQFGNRVHLEW